MYITAAIITAVTSGLTATTALNFMQKRKSKKLRQLPTPDA